MKQNTLSDQNMAAAASNAKNMADFLKFHIHILVI